MRSTIAWALVYVALALLAFRLLVWWLEPRMAFFPIRGVQETPAALGLPFEDVYIETPDGETLHAWWMHQPDARAQVVFWHGNGGNLSLWLDVIAGLYRRGFNVLAVDFRGYGASTGRPSERGLYLDADAGTRYFLDRFHEPGTPMVYWGRSLGAPVAAYAAVRLPPDGLVLESPFPDVRAVLAGNPVMWLLSLLSSYRFPTSEFLREYRGPLLVVHGDDDRIIPFELGRRVFEGANEPRTFATIPGADHNDLHLVSPERYWTAVEEFIGSVRRQAGTH